MILLDSFLDMIGFSRHKINYTEKLISTLGGGLGIFAILTISYWFIDPEVAVFIVPSMGASAVLLFAAPNVPFAQPWNIIGGHVISAVIGVMCYDFIPDITIAASASVGFATGAMYFARCIHPPGGATALAAVIGSEKLHDLGYSFVFEPILLNTVTIFLVAIIFNSFFKWRKYPASWPFRQGATVSISKEKYAPINYDDFVYAMNHIDTPVDINEVDLLKIYKIATNRDMNSKDNSCK